MGHLLKREERTDPDSRVDHFIPDSWQVCLRHSLCQNQNINKRKNELDLGSEPVFCRHDTQAFYQHLQLTDIQTIKLTLLCQD